MSETTPTTTAATDRRATLSYAQVMVELGCSKRHVYNLFSRGELTGFFMGLGRGLRIYKASVQSFKKRKSDPNA